MAAAEGHAEDADAENWDEGAKKNADDNAGDEEMEGARRWTSQTCTDATRAMQLNRIDLYCAITVAQCKNCESVPGLLQDYMIIDRSSPNTTRKWFSVA